MKRWELTFEVQADTQEQAIQQVIERLNMGGEPDSCDESDEHDPHEYEQLSK